MNLDYTVDYRRYSYTDFKITSDSGGQSTVAPELLTVHAMTKFAAPCCPLVSEGR